MKNRLKKKRVPNVPIFGKAKHNAAFLIGIGNLIVNWANNESVFLAMLQLLIVGSERSAAIVWNSHRTSNAKLELVHRLCRERIKDPELLCDISKAISQFKGYSRVRNLYCHATYSYDSEFNLRTAFSATFTQDGEPLVFEKKNMDLATLNEINDASMKLATFNRELWDLVKRLQNELGVQHVDLPELPPLQT